MAYGLMKDALNKRRLNGVDLTIIVGKPEGEDEKGSDRAPMNPKSEANKEPPMGRGSPMEEMLAQMGMNEEESPEEEVSMEDQVKSSIMGDMSPGEEDRLKESKPKSLMERAKQEALMKGKK